MFLFEAFQFIIGEKYIIQKNCLLVYSLLLWPIVLQANSSPGSYHHLQGRQKPLIAPPKTGFFCENLFLASAEKGRERKP